MSNVYSPYSVSKVVETKAQPAVGWEVAAVTAAAVPLLIAAAATDWCSSENSGFRLSTTSNQLSGKYS
jgi:hypothetical protein